MSLVNRKLPRSLFVAILAFMLSLGGVLNAPSAQAAITSADVYVECGTQNDGSARVYVQNVMPVGESYSIVRQYENGLSSVDYVPNGVSTSIPLFGPYGQPLGPEGDDVDGVVVGLVATDMTEFAGVTFNRDPACGVRPNRPPVVSNVSASGARYDDPIFVPFSTSNAYDPDDDALSYSVTSAPAHGSAQFVPLSDELESMYPDATAVVAYYPDGTYLGDEIMTYQVDDGRGGTSSATLTVAVGDSTPVTAAAPTFVAPTRPSMVGKVTVPVMAGVRYSLESATLNVSSAAGTYSLPAGSVAKVKAYATQPGTSLVGTKSWQATFRTFLKVVTTNTSGNRVYNKVRVANPNSFGVWFRHGDFTAPSTKQDARIWIAAGSTVYVPTARKVLDWTASNESDWTDASQLATHQIRATGKIVADCVGTRNYVRVYMNNVGSTMTVEYSYSIRSHAFTNIWVGAGKTATRTQTRYNIKPGNRMVLYVKTPAGTKVLWRSTAPSGCSN